MSIDHNSSASLNGRPVQDAGRTGGCESERPREAPPKEEVDRFRQLMQPGRRDGRAELQEREQGPRRSLEEPGRPGGLAASRHAIGEAAAQGPQERQDARDGTDHHGMGANSIDGADLLAMMQAQSALRDGAMAPPPSVPAPPMASGKALAEMLERHVRQFAVGGATAADGDGQVLLRMADATLPGTDLLLSRTADGWHLRADVRSRDSYDAILEAAPALARRFAEQNLGTLEIDPHLDA